MTSSQPLGLSEILPESGPGDSAVMAMMDELVGSHSTPLGDPLAFAHMDPPASKVASFVVGLNAKTNQNLLHPSLSPLATLAEQSGSTLANLTALWCAREAGATRVVASIDAHLSVQKAAHILGLPFHGLSIDDSGKAVLSDGDVTENDCLVLTAGTTSRGAIDPLQRPAVKWLHVDAAWAGPLRLTRYANRLDGIEHADSVAVSAHKWLYQPKDSAMVLFKDPESRDKVSFGGDYLAVPNVGVQGSRSASGLALLATLMAGGRAGVAASIEKNMADAARLAASLDEMEWVELKQPPETAVINWRSTNRDVSSVVDALGITASLTRIDGDPWVRQVAANPHADVDRIVELIDRITQPI